MIQREQAVKSGNTFSCFLLKGRQSWGIIRFCLLFFLYITSFYIFIQILNNRTDLLSGLSIQLASLTSWFINRFGMGTLTDNTIIYNTNGFALRISYKCTGILHIVFFLAGILATHKKFLKKISFIVIGIALISAVNILRIAGLFFIGINAYSWFDFFHEVLAEIFMILFTFFIWFFCMKRIK